MKITWLLGILVVIAITVAHPLEEDDSKISGIDAEQPIGLLDVDDIGDIQANTGARNARHHGWGGGWGGRGGYGRGGWGGHGGWGGGGWGGRGGYGRGGWGW